MKELDTVQNAGLRICSGVFRISPVESIYVDTEELPLDLRREELGLRYVMKLNGSPENPAANALQGFNPLKFAGVRASKPLTLRLEASLENDSIKTQRLRDIKCSKQPPWLIPEPSICPKILISSSKIYRLLRARFYDHDRIHCNSIKIYTDGSKTSDGVGCSVIHDDSSYVGRLSNNASIFTAELTGLVKSLEMISTLRGRNFTIYCDSYSALMAIKKYNPQNLIIQGIQDWLCRLSSKLKSVSFCWVPDHVGIQGNEIVDTEAKAAIGREILFHHVPFSDMKPVIREYIRNKWQNRWASPLLPNNKKYKSIRSSVTRWMSSYQKSRYCFK